MSVGGIHHVAIPLRSFVCKEPDGYLLEFVRFPTRQEIIAYRSQHTRDT